jgi:phenylalanyl-tRNA synthetase alpha chain
LANDVRTHLEAMITARSAALDRQEADQALDRERLDVTLPGLAPVPGRSHPLMRVWEELEQLFLGMGFDVVEGNEIETDFFNFEALNVPKDHPARDMQDSFYVADDIVLRTQTSSVQVQMLRKLAPRLPVRLIHLGRVYRRGDDDMNHSPMFHQCEGLLVDKGIGLHHLKGLLLEFARKFYGPQTDVRMRPSYFPFTEPSAEVDVTCAWCRGRGCRVCKGTGWVEILGAGMVHPVVLRHGGYDPEQVTGLAWGMGLDRQAQLRFEIDHVRLMFANDWRMLRQI